MLNTKFYTHIKFKNFRSILRVLKSNISMYRKLYVKEFLFFFILEYLFCYLHKCTNSKNFKSIVKSSVRENLIFEIYVCVLNIF